MSTKDLILAADFGTSAVKVGVVDSEMQLQSHTAEGYPLHLAPGGCAEQVPEDWWAALAVACHRLREGDASLKDRIGAVVFTGQLCGLVCADQSGAALRNCMIWMDIRTAEHSRRMIGGFPSFLGYRLDKLAKWVRVANGAPSRNGMDPPSKMKFVAEQEPDVFAQTYRFLDVKDWLLHKATGRFVTTSDAANLTWLMDTRPGHEGWSESLAGMTGLSLEKMPEIVDGTSVVGGLTLAAAADLGLADGVPVVAGGGDVTATALGSGAVGDGDLHIALSTSAWIGGFFDRRILSPLHSFATVASSIGHRPLLIATQESGGSTLEWAQKATGAADVETAFRDLGDPLADDPFLIPWFSGERVPVDDHALRGVLHGLTLAHDGTAIRRAAVEGVALNLAWAYEAVLRKTKVSSSAPLPLVGGASDLPVMAQTVANTLNRTVVNGAGRFTGVLGAAAIAAPALQWDEDAWSAAKRIAPPNTRHYEPDRDGVAHMKTRNAALGLVRRRMLKSFGGMHP